MTSPARLVAVIALAITTLVHAQGGTGELRGQRDHKTEHFGGNH